jgi:REP element-mobilizing transposase RayT
MQQDPFQYYRRSLQSHRYNYAQGGVYFVTLCTHNRECILGDVVEGEMQLNDYGKIVREE